MDKSILTQEQNGYRLPENERRKILSQSDNPAGKITPKMRKITAAQRKQFFAQQRNLVATSHKKTTKDWRI